MKKRKGLPYVLLPVIVTLGAYISFYSRITCKPNQAGFWVIIALGISIGVAITRFVQWSNKRNTEL